MDIKTLYETTDLTYQEIANKLGISVKVVFNFIKRNYTKQFSDERKSLTYRKSKLAEKNPMFGKRGSEVPNYIGVVSDNKGYYMVVKPEWYTGRKGSRHIFVHHEVVCRNLGITAVPKGWQVHHCDYDTSNNSFDNLVLMTMKDHMILHRRVLKGATTISKESTLKWVEAHGTPWRDDIVSSTQECVAAKAVED